jgi:hypothetical protein
MSALILSKADLGILSFFAFSPTFEDSGFEMALLVSFQII